MAKYRSGNLLIGLPGRKPIEPNSDIPDIIIQELKELKIDKEKKVSSFDSLVSKGHIKELTLVEAVKEAILPSKKEADSEPEKETKGVSKKVN